MALCEQTRNQGFPLEARGIKGYALTHQRMVELRNGRNEMQTDLDLLPRGIILIRANKEVISMNRSAGDLIKKRDGLIATSRFIRAFKTNETVELDRLIGAAIAVPNGTGIMPGGTTQVSRNNRSPLHVLIAPTRNFAFDISSRLGAVVFVSNPEQRMRPHSGILGDLFKLTPAESRSMLLGDGMSLHEVSQVLQVSRNTLKTHLSRITQKPEPHRSLCDL